MEKLSFSTGLKEFELPGGQVLSFTPTDPALMGRIYKAFEKLDKSQKDYSNPADDAKAFFEYVEKLDKEMQETLDGLFGVHIDRAAFNNCSLFAVADGLPLWANFIFAVMDVMDIELVQSQKAQNPRLEKLMAKYKKK